MLKSGDKTCHLQPAGVCITMCWSLCFENPGFSRKFECSGWVFLSVNWKQGTILFMDFFPLQYFIIDHVYNIGPLIFFCIGACAHIEIQFSSTTDSSLDQSRCSSFFLKFQMMGVLFVFYAVSFNFGWKMKF